MGPFGRARVIGHETVGGQEGQLAPVFEERQVPGLKKSLRPDLVPSDQWNPWPALIRRT